MREQAERRPGLRADRALEELQVVAQPLARDAQGVQFLVPAVLDGARAAGQEQRRVPVDDTAGRVAGALPLHRG